MLQVSDVTSRVLLNSSHADRIARHLDNKDATCRAAGIICSARWIYLQRGKGPDQVGQMLPAEGGCLSAGQPGSDLTCHIGHEPLQHSMAIYHSQADITHVNQDSMRGMQGSAGAKQGRRAVLQSEERPSANKHLSWLVEIARRLAHRVLELERCQGPGSVGDVLRGELREGVIRMLCQGRQALA